MDVSSLVTGLLLSTGLLAPGCKTDFAICMETCGRIYQQEMQEHAGKPPRFEDPRTCEPCCRTHFKGSGGGRYGIHPDSGVCTPRKIKKP